jgi:hypothetical protein
VAEFLGSGQDARVSGLLDKARAAERRASAARARARMASERAARAEHTVTARRFEREAERHASASVIHWKGAAHFRELASFSEVTPASEPVLA